MKLVLGGIEVIEQPLRVQSAAGAGYGNKYSQGGWSIKLTRLAKYGGVRQIRQAGRILSNIINTRYSQG